MKVQIPYNLDTKVMNEKQTMVAAFLALCFDYAGADAELYMNGGDFKRIAGSQFCTPECAYLEELQKVFRIGILSDHNWSISLRKGKGQVARELIKVKDAYIQKQDNIRIWYFLLGRMHDPSHVITDFIKPLTFETNDCSLSQRMNRATEFNFYDKAPPKYKQKV